MSGFNGGFLRPTKNRGSFIPMYWGDGSDGVLTAGDVYHAGTDYVTYSDLCIKQFSQINWDPATPETLTVDKQCRGLVIFVNGDAYIGTNAKISMSKLSSTLPVSPEVFLEMYGDSVQMRHIVDTLKTLRGGEGGDGGNDQGSDYLGGTHGPGRICQGAFGAGGASSTGNGGSTTEPELLGWPGLSYGVSSVGSFGGAYGYHGTPAKYGGGGASTGGSANPGGVGASGEPPGGFILFIVKGTLMIAGAIDIEGGPGGNARTDGGGGDGGGGGGNGGGVFAAFAGTAVDISSATINKSGGPGGTSISGGNGTGGQQGTTYTESLS